MEKESNNQEKQTLSDITHKQIHAHKLGVCIAPAGYGKSHLLRDYQQHYHRPAHPVYLFTITHDGAENDKLFSALKTQIKSASQKRCTLLLDDAHLLSADESRRYLLPLIDMLAPDMHLLISARHEPPFSYNKWLVTGEAFQFDRSHFQLDLAATHDIVAESIDTDADIEKLTGDIFRRCEGWPAATKLCTLLYKQMKDPDFIEEVSGRSPVIASYIHEHVVANLTSDDKAFCAYLAHFSPFSGALINAAFAMTNAGSRIAHMYKHHLVFEALDTAQNQFRFHPLIRDYFLSQPEALSPEQTRVAYQRASDWCIQNALHVQAIDYAIAAKNYEAIIPLLYSSAQAIIRDQGMLPKLIEWCEQIPLDHSPASINLHFWLAWSFAFSCLHDEARKRIRMLRQGISETAELKKSDRHLLNSRISSLNIALEIFQDNSDWTSRQAQKWLRAYQAIADPFDISVVASARFLSARLSLNASEAKQAISLAKQFIPKAKSLYGSMWISALDGLYEMEFGEYHIAKDILRDAYNRLGREEKTESPMRSTIALLLAKVYYEIGDLAQAEQSLSVGLVHIDKHGLTESAAAGISIDIRLTAQKQSKELALYKLSKAEFMVGNYTPRLHFVLQKLRIELLVDDGKLDLAIEEASRAGIQILPDSFVLHEIDTPLIYAEKFRLGIYLQYHLGQYSNALTQMPDFLEQIKLQHRSLFQIEILILYSALLFKTESKQMACRQLTNALKKAAQSKLIHVFVERSEFVKPVFKELISRRQGGLLLPEDALINRLTREFDLNPLEGEALFYEAPEFTEREKELLSLLASPLNVQQIADYLFLSKATIKTHLHNIYKKLEVKNRSGAIEKVTRYKLTP